MSRKRVIDPEFWVDDTLAEVDFTTRLFYIALWNFSDDYGVIEFSPKKIKAQSFPYDSIDVSPLLEKLISLKKLLVFEAEDKKWLYIKNFTKWQRVDKPSTKRNPPSPFDEPSTSPREDSTPKRREVKRREVKRREVKRREEKPQNHFSYLENIPVDDLKEFTYRFDASEHQVKSKGEDLANYCRAKDKVTKYSDFKAFLVNALKKDFKELTEKQRKEREATQPRIQATIKKMAEKHVDSDVGTPEVVDYEKLKALQEKRKQLLNNFKT